MSAIYVPENDIIGAPMATDIEYDPEWHDLMVRLSHKLTGVEGVNTARCEMVGDQHVLRVICEYTAQARVENYVDGFLNDNK